MDKISIIVPAYNCERYIDRCIQSLLNQTYENNEIIIVDDGSKDNTYSLCEQYNSYRNVRLFHISNHGVSYARNYGLKFAEGNYIFFVDADDYVKNNYCEVLVKEIRDRKADLAICGFTTYEEKKINEIRPGSGLYSLNEFMDIFITTEFVNMPWAKVYKKEKIKTLFNEQRDMGEDFEFNMEYLISCHRITCINDSLYVYNLENNASLTKNIAKMGAVIGKDVNTVIKNFEMDSELAKRFILRRIKNYLVMVNENTESQTDYNELANVIGNDSELKNLVRKMGIKDFRIYLLFNGYMPVLRTIQKILNIIQ